VRCGEALLACDADTGEEDLARVAVLIRYGAGDGFRAFERDGRERAGEFV
jgi:hypothetical protein